MPDLPQPGWPLQFTTLPDGSVQYADVEQNTPADQKARAAIVISTPRGHRDDEPTFGITPILFQAGQIDTGRLAAEIAQSDPLLQIDAQETTALLDNTKRAVTVDVGQAT